MNWTVNPDPFLNTEAQLSPLDPPAVTYFLTGGAK